MLAIGKSSEFIYSSKRNPAHTRSNEAICLHFVNFPMYDWPEVSHIWDAFWDNLRKKLAGRTDNLPKLLSRSEYIDTQWKDSNLLLGQTCGWPYVSRLADKAALVGTLDFRFSNCPAGYYHSVLICSENAEMHHSAEAIEKVLSGDLRFGVNGINSQSGFRAFRDLPTAHPLSLDSISNMVTTGSHRNSIKAVAEGHADIALIDAISLELACAFEPAAESIRKLAHTQPRPGLPFITSRKNVHLAPVLKQTIEEVLVANPIKLTDTCVAHGIAPIPKTVYDNELLGEGVSDEWGDI